MIYNRNQHNSSPIRVETLCSRNLLHCHAKTHLRERFLHTESIIWKIIQFSSHSQRYINNASKLFKRGVAKQRLLSRYWTHIFHSQKTINNSKFFKRESPRRSSPKLVASRAASDSQLHRKHDPFDLNGSSNLAGWNCQSWLRRRFAHMYVSFSPLSWPCFPPAFFLLPVTFAKLYVSLQNRPHRRSWFTLRVYDAR